MCCNAGMYSYHEHSSPVDQAELMHICEHVIARAPDDEGLSVSGCQSLGLAHRPLAIIDLNPGGAQPMHDQKAGHWIVFNGETYNHAGLRERSNREGIVTSTHSYCASCISIRGLRL